jgi:hypothetical protein
MEAHKKRGSNRTLPPDNFAPGINSNRGEWSTFYHSRSITVSSEHSNRVSILEAEVLNISEVVETEKGAGKALPEPTDLYNFLCKSEYVSPE